MNVGVGIKVKPIELRERFIKATITVIARDGLDKATTKLIGLEAQLNEAYIYRCFEDKEMMFFECFEELDDELVSVTTKNIEIMYQKELDFEIRCRLYFKAIWEFLLGNKEKCLAFIRYYYSQQFQKYAAEKHKARYVPLVEKFKVAFKDEADVWMILNHILNVMLDFAFKVHNNQMPENDDYSEHVYRVIYASVKQYFRD